jgi:XrtJ-associated TM-motif-TM protein
MKNVFYVLSAALLLCVTTPLYAQGGCVNSPENPTIVLALVGSAGAAIAAARRRYKR